jgi:mannosyltransferase
MTPVKDQLVVTPSQRVALPLQIQIRQKIEGIALTPVRTAAIIVATTLIGTGLRLHLLATRSLWIDEASSVCFAALPWRPFLKLLWHGQANMVLYYVILRAWLHLGDGEFVVRSLSVLFGIAAIPAVYTLGARLFDRRTGVTAAILLSVHSFHVHWSQEARAYSLLTLLLVLTAHVLVSALESSRSRRHWIIFAIAAVMCVYTHVFAVLVLAGYAVAIVFPRPYSVNARMIALAGGIFAVLVSPMVVFVFLHREGSAISWVPRPTLSEISEAMQLMTSQGGVLLVLLYLALCILAVVHSTKTSATDKEGWVVRLLVLWLVLPFAVTLAASLIRPIFYPRYMVMCVPAMVLLGARGLTCLSDWPAVKHWAGATAMALVVLLSGWGVRNYFGDLYNVTSDWRSAVGFIVEHQQPGDGAFFFIANPYPYEYYTNRAERQHKLTAAPDVLYPSATGQPLSRDEVRAVTRGRERVWLVLHFASDHPQELSIIQSTIAEGFQLEEQHVFTAGDPITILLYRHSGASRLAASLQR